MFLLVYPLLISFNFWTHLVQQDVLGWVGRSGPRQLVLFREASLREWCQQRERPLAFRGALACTEDEDVIVWIIIFYNMESMFDTFHSVSNCPMLEFELQVTHFVTFLEAELTILKTGLKVSQVVKRCLFSVCFSFNALKATELTRCWRHHITTSSVLKKSFVMVPICSK